MIVLEERSKITDKGQTTVPKRVRERLGVTAGDEIIYRVSEDGSIVVESARRGDDETAIDAFLAFLSSDIKHRPSSVTPMLDEDARRIAALLDGVEVDIDGDFDGATPI